jgi:hypothetical protein
MGGFCDIKYVQDDDNEDSGSHVIEEGDIIKIWCKDCRRMFSTLEDPTILNHSPKHEIIFDF